MKHLILLALAIPCLFFTISCKQTSDKDLTIKNDSKDLEALDAYIQSLEQEGIYGSFLLMENDKVLYQKSIGYANKERRIKNNTTTVYPYGSIVKDYTLTVILLLETEGKLNTQDKISKYFDNVPEDKKNITIGQVLKHTSGLTEYHDLDPKIEKKYWDLGYPNDLFPMTQEESLQVIFGEKLQFEPGTEEGYSNSGYTLLAYIIEKVTQKPFDQAVHDYILSPAKTQKADFYSSSLWTPNEVAVGYSDVTYGKENSPVYWPRNPGALIGNGGLAGTLTDLYLGTKYMLSLEETNPKFKELTKEYLYTSERPANFLSSAGGGMLGFVAVTSVIKDKNQYLIFASNNNTEGEDDRMLQKVMTLGFGFEGVVFVSDEEDD